MPARGKTTLAECMLYEAGLINRRGSIDQRNTVGDYHPLEQERGNSIFSKLMHTKWRGYKINILDTPGYDDFVGEVLSALASGRYRSYAFKCCHGCRSRNRYYLGVHREI